MIWLTTDTHFGHDKLFSEWNTRPEDFSDRLWKGLNNNLKPEDVLIHLGDVCIGNDEEMHAHYIQTINCAKKILVRGNHDRKSREWYMAHGWDWVCETFSDHYFGVNILFSHVPIKEDDYHQKNIHGHFHALDHRKYEPWFTAIYNKQYHHLLAVELNNYQPWSLKSIIDGVSKNTL